jgi:rSAM/selenodomain-associated transferase 1
VVDLAGAAVVTLLTRAPSAGGKSRLFRAIGRAPDPALLRALLLDTLDAVAAAGVPRLIAVEPPAACGEVRALAPAVDVFPQIDGTLGARMAAAMSAAFARGASAVALIGSDLPDIQPRVITDAFAALDRDPSGLILGPADDGGYYLIAARSVPPLFDAIEWGSERVLGQTLAAARQRGIRVHLLERMSDVDTAADLDKVAAPRTRAWRMSTRF